MNEEQLHDLILQSLEHEMGGVKVYEAALQCVTNNDLKEEWAKYLQQTRTHVEILVGVCEAFGLNPNEDAPSRKVVGTIGGALVLGMKMAMETGNPRTAELVACEAVVLAETKDHADWELLRKCADKLTGNKSTVLGKACDEVEEQEDEHLYHSKGWCRELWMKSLGLPPLLPPPEERKDVKTAIGAARAEKAAEKTRKKSNTKR